MFRPARGVQIDQRTYELGHPGLHFELQRACELGFLPVTPDVPPEIFWAIAPEIIKVAGERNSRGWGILTDLRLQDAATVHVSEHRVSRKILPIAKVPIRGLAEIHP